jgi:drug/metabolite transporter (DMT)-like permease
MTEKQVAGAFDVRNVIAALIGFYGVVLLLVAIFGDDEPEKTGGIDANLWAGLGMLVFAAGFALWSRLRPVVVDPGADVAGEEGER